MAGEGISDTDKVRKDKPKIFISYSHDSEEHKERVLSLSDELSHDGIDCKLDQHETSPPEGWPRWCARQFEDSKFVLVVCTESYLERFNNVAPFGTGKGVKFEGYIITQELYDNDSLNTKFIPVIFSPEDAAFIPKPLKGSTVYTLENEDDYDSLYRHITGQHAVPKPLIGDIRTLPVKERKKLFDRKISESSTVTPRVFVSKLPQTGPDLFGRERELALLDKAWDDPHQNIVCFSAMGGAGKTSLVKKWLNLLSLDNYRKAEEIYAWSFYSQGAEEGKQASADEFISHALGWFGYNGPMDKSGWEKGEKLAELIRQKRTLFILDGVEPLQYPPGEMQGRLKDQGLQSLLRELAAQNNGLCIITTRLSIADIEDARETVQDIPLEHLSEEAGTQLLRSMGVSGSDAELKQASAEFKGHALALTLLGSYLSAVHDGEIRKRDLIPKLTDDERKGGHVRRVMKSYIKWLAGKPELNILFLMGLFDRPATGGAIAALRAKPVINNLTNEICKLSEDQWQFAVQHLRELRLIDKKNDKAPDTLDCHPLIREYFGERLKLKHQIAWKKAHSRLYDFFKAQAPEFPNTIEEMAPLYSAVAHCCAAGRHQEAMEGVFWKRICKEREFFSTKKLGAFGAELNCLSHFFENLWHIPAEGLILDFKAFVLSHAGFTLRALGRLTEAAEPMQAGMEMRITQKNWENAAINAGNLSELFLIIGVVGEAVDYAEKGVGYADKCENSFMKMYSRTTHADALHQAGCIDEAERLFIEAEEMQKKRQPEYPCLYSLGGFRYCDLLLGKGDYQEVLERAGRAMESAIEENQLLSIALDNLSLGRGHMLQGLSDSSRDYSVAERHLNKAVEGLIKAGTQHYQPLGLIARAELYHIKKDFKKTKHDLDEAMTICTRGEMRLYEADCHLGYARLYLAMDEKAKAWEHHSIAKEVIEEMGYHRRGKEIQDLEEKLQEN